jgi:hypothetical protein
MPSSEAEKQMSKERSPQDKKELAKEKDHFSPSEYPHAFRRQWPQKKARVERAFRHKAKQTLQEITAYNEEDAPQFTKREGLKKWGTITLAERIEGTLYKRTQHIAWNYFKMPWTYQSSVHRERFKAFLISVMQGRSETSVKIAHFFEELLQIHQAWFQAFFQEEPTMEHSLRAWINERLASQQNP